MKRGFDKRGLSEVVTTLLFVLLALGAVVLVWYLVSGLIKGGTSSVNLEKACLDLEMEIVSCDFVNTANTANVVYKRGNNELPEGFSLVKLKLLFEMSSGETGSVEVSGVGTIPGALESKSKSVNFQTEFGLSGVVPAKVGVAAILLSDGKESACGESARVSCS